MRPKSATYAPIKWDNSHSLLFHAMGIPWSRDATSFLQRCVTTRITTILCFHSCHWNPPTWNGASKSTSLFLGSFPANFYFVLQYWNSLVFCLILITLQATIVEQLFHNRVKLPFIRDRVPSVIICLKSYSTLIGWELFWREKFSYTESLYTIYF